MLDFLFKIKTFFYKLYSRLIYNYEFRWLVCGETIVASYNPSDYLWIRCFPSESVYRFINNGYFCTEDTHGNFLYKNQMVLLERRYNVKINNKKHKKSIIYINELRKSRYKTKYRKPNVVRLPA